MPWQLQAVPSQLRSTPPFPQTHSIQMVLLLVVVVVVVLLLLLLLSAAHTFI
jgi:uncharacterized membrane protein YidH (DUF202 family)